MPPASFAEFIASLRTQIAARAPDLLFYYDIYAGEARFGRQWLEPELQKLAPGSAILEVGAGMFLLACQLQREGFAVTALEPVSSGFDHFHRLQQAVLEFAGQHGALPVLLASPAEALALERRFAFAYSLNVMEHVADPGVVMARVMASLIPGAHYRFVCPNYAFPFEPHFRIPIVINKSITERLFKRSILKLAATIEDPQGGWDGLNWITVAQVRRKAKKLDLSVCFCPSILVIYLDRALNEPSFCDRHPLINRLMRLMKSLGLLQALRLIPVRWMPVMDCTLTPSEKP